MSPLNVRFPRISCSRNLTKIPEFLLNISNVFWFFFPFCTHPQILTIYNPSTLLNFLWIVHFDKEEEQFWKEHFWIALWSSELAVKYGILDLVNYIQILNKNLHNMQRKKPRIPNYKSKYNRKIIGKLFPKSISEKSILKFLSIPVGTDNEIINYCFLMSI